MSTRTRAALTWLPVALIAGVFIACGSAPSGQSPAPNVSAQDTTAAPAVPAGPGSSADDPAPVGASVEPAKGWTVTVTQANLQGDAAMAAVNQFNKPQPGQRYVLVNVGIRNNSGKPAAPNSALKVSALAAGAAVSTDYTPAPAPKLDLNAQLQPGVTAQGWVPFQVSVAADKVVLLAEPLFTMDQNEDQRFLALT